MGETALINVDPPLLYPDYRSTRLRAPKRPLVTLPEAEHDLAAPVYAHDLLGDRDNDLTRQHEGEPQGERIIVTGRVLDDDGRPIRDSLVEIWQANASGRYSKKVKGTGKRSTFQARVTVAARDVLVRPEDDRLQACAIARLAAGVRQ